MLVKVESCNLPVVLNGPSAPRFIHEDPTASCQAARVNATGGVSNQALFDLLDKLEREELG
jgi:hypothetical protein